MERWRPPFIINVDGIFQWCDASPARGFVKESRYFLVFGGETTDKRQKANPPQQSAACSIVASRRLASKWIPGREMELLYPDTQKGTLT